MIADLQWSLNKNRSIDGIVKKNLKRDMLKTYASVEELVSQTQYSAMILDLFPDTAWKDWSDRNITANSNSIFSFSGRDSYGAGAFNTASTQDSEDENKTEVLVDSRSRRHPSVMEWIMQLNVHYSGNIKKNAIVRYVKYCKNEPVFQ